MNFRSLEKTTKFGYLIYISYKGRSFHSFDENKDKEENKTKKTVKGEFIRIMEELGVNWAKGVQQGGRTDAGVSGRENILYFSSNNKIDKIKLKERFNKLAKGIKILKIEKTLPNLVIPELVIGREYSYRYPEEKILEKEEKIQERARELSGRYDVSGFTDQKGTKLKEKVREVEVRYKDKELYFKGNSFLPKQVRIMSGYILTGEKKILPGRYLTLEKINISQELKSYIIEDIDGIEVENVEKVEKIQDVYIFYVGKNKKGKVIGKNAQNIKALRKKYGKIIIKTL